MFATTDLGAAAPTVHLKKSRLLDAARERKWRTARDLARGLGLNPSQISRALDDSHPQRPGATFIASVLTAFPDKRFEDFFEIGTPIGLSDRRAS